MAIERQGGAHRSRVRWELDHHLTEFGVGKQLLPAPCTSWKRDHDFA